MPLPHESLELTRFDIPENNEFHRPVVISSLGPHLHGAALPHADPADPITTLGGVRKRIAARTPVPDPELLAKFKVFVAEQCCEMFQPLPADTCTQVKEWLERTPYERRRKDELLLKNTKVQDRFDPKYTKLKCFMKDESYEEAKHPRGIFSRTDEYKTFVGPIFDQISSKVFANECFIKKIPVSQRPRYILNFLHPGCKILTTDFTAYESSFVKEVQEACEFELYRYMTQHMPEQEQFFHHLEALVQDNECVFKNFSIKLQAKRMSGEMNTSLGNGFSNLMLMRFVCQQLGIPPEDIRMLVEGDDGITSVLGSVLPSPEDFAKLGFIVKLEVWDSIHKASFCGIVFHPDDCNTVTNPITEIATFGWTTHKYAKAGRVKRLQLLKSKSLSMIYQYPGCPILQSMALYGLRVTSGYKADTNSWSNMYEKELLEEAIAHIPDPKPIGMGTRQLVAELYKVSIPLQLEIENYFNNKKGVGPIILPQIAELIPQIWKDYWEGYVRDTYISSHMNYPATYWHRDDQRSLFLSLVEPVGIPYPNIPCLHLKRQKRNR